jgi:hypothetical protein
MPKSLDKKQILFSVMAAALSIPMIAGTANAEPLLLITHLPVQNNGNTGPAFDPSASAGQWFQNVSGFNGNEPIVSGTYENRAYQFHDNIAGNGGGFAGSNAIRGVITNLVLNGNNQVTDFTVRASITYDPPAIGQWANGSNSHEETLSTINEAIDKLVAAKLSVNFADDGIRGNFPATPPFALGEPNIYAKNYDQLAWFSYTPTGGFYVPTFDFGLIGMGQTLTRDLQFGLYTPEDPTKYIAWGNQSTDLFVSRSTNLKIGNYASSLAADDGSAYPTSVPYSGNVSVFADIPEPGTLALLGIGLAGLGFSRKKRTA